MDLCLSPLDEHKPYLLLYDKKEGGNGKLLCFALNFLKHTLAGGCKHNTICVSHVFAQKKHNNEELNSFAKQLRIV